MQLQVIIRTLQKVRNVDAIKLFLIQLNSYYKAWSYKKKKPKKIKAYRESVQKEPTVKMCLIILDLKAVQIIGQGEVFYRQRFSASNCAKKETVGIGILLTSRDGDRKIMQSIRVTNRPNLGIRKRNHFSQFR